jgi:hypothetical protein
MKDLKKPFDEAEARAQILLKTLDVLTGGDNKLHFESKEVQTVLEMLKKIGIDFTKADEIAEDFGADLAAIDMKKLLLGDEFDANTAKLQVYEKQLNKFLDEVLDKKNRPEGPTLLDKNQIEAYVKGIKDAKDAIESFEDERNMKFLRAMSDAFGDIDTQIEVVNGALQAAERTLRNIGMEEGASEKFLKWARYVESLRAELDQLEASKSIKFFEDMTNALKDGGYYLELLNAKIAKLRTELERMSGKRMGNEEEYIKKAKELEAMQNRADAIKILQDSLADFFSMTREDMQNFDEFVRNWAKSLVQSFQRMVAEMLAQKIIGAIFGGVANVATGGGFGAAASFFNFSPGFKKAKGGIIPSGYPNDTYPALLSSGEAVLPTSLMNKLGKNKPFEGEVRFEIEGDRLVGILKKKSKQNSLY